MKNFVIRDKITKAVVGTQQGPAAPVNAQHDFVEITDAERVAINEARHQASQEHRSITYDGGIILGDIPPDIARIDLDGPSVMKPGDTAVLSLELLGSGTLTLNLGGQNFQLHNSNRRIELTLTAS